MSRFYLKYTGDSDSYSDERWEYVAKEEVITHEFSTEDLYEVVQRMEQFLKGAGFVFSGALEIVPTSAENSEEWYVSDTKVPWPFPVPQADTEYVDKNFDPT